MRQDVPKSYQKWPSKFDAILHYCGIQAVVELTDLPGRRLQAAIQMSRFAWQEASGSNRNEWFCVVGRLRQDVAKSYQKWPSRFDAIFQYLFCAPGRRVQVVTEMNGFAR